MNNSLSIVPIGGRVKAASLGLDTLGTSQDPVEVTRHIQALRKQPTPELQKAYFPLVGDTLKHRLRDIGLYRPVLKTDQGMPGNFFSFHINMQQEEDSFDVAKALREEGIAIPEPHANLPRELVERVQRSFHRMQLGKVFGQLQQIPALREANKGRDAFFFIRAAETEEPLVLGANTIQAAQLEVQKVLQKISQGAQELEENFQKSQGVKNKSYAGDKLLYCQPDVFVLKDGIQVEKINCPDVGFFLTEVETGDHSGIFQEVRETVHRLMDPVVSLLAKRFPEGLTLITRDEVLRDQEDVLEQQEIVALRNQLAKYHVPVHVIALSDLEHIPAHLPALLLNIDYNHPSATALLERHCRDEIDCYPNPFFQMASRQVSGLKTVELEGKYLEKLLFQLKALPESDAAIRDVHKRIQQCLQKCEGMGENLIHVDLGNEVVPFHPSSLHSSRVVYSRIQRQKERGIPVEKITLRELPARKDNLRIADENGARLHTFRFMCVNQNL